MSRCASAFPETKRVQKSIIIAKILDICGSDVIESASCKTLGGNWLRYTRQTTSGTHVAIHISVRISLEEERAHSIDTTLLK